MVTVMKILISFGSMLPLMIGLTLALFSSSCSSQTLEPISTPRPTTKLTPTPTTAQAPTSPPARIQARVTRVIDGDTIEVEIGGKPYTVRYIGIDTPETVDPRRPVQRMGQEASEKNKELVGGKVVTLEKDVSETDRYGRLLRYVYVNSLFINAELVRLGYAQVATFPPDVKYQELFLRMQREAKENKRGLWAEEVTPTVAPRAKPTVASTAPKPTAKVAATPIPTKSTPTATPEPIGGFDPTRYIGQGDRYNCSDFKSQADAQTVLRADPRDPNKLDNNRDGIACESNPAPYDKVPVPRS